MSEESLSEKIKEYFDKKHKLLKTVDWGKSFMQNDDIVFMNEGDGKLVEAIKQKLKDFLSVLEKDKMFLMNGGQLAEWLHNSYEDISKEVGWKTQESCRVPFDKLPKENQRVMLRLAQKIQVEFFTRYLLNIREESKKHFGDDLLK
jgi:hypothetical protein